MTTDVVAVAYGRPASEALARAVSNAKAGDALAAVTVLVPSNFAGLAARRVLGQGLVGGSGIANVSFLTVFGLAERLAAGHHDGHKPLTNPVLGAAVRRALRSAPGPFAAVASHHATERALAALYAELSHISPAARDAVASGHPTGALAVRMFDQIAAGLGGYADERDTAMVARESCADPARTEALGSIVWFLPQPLHPALAALVGEVLARQPSTVIAGLSGDAAADAGVVDVCRTAGVTVPMADRAVVVGDHIISVTDADEEVRAVVRRVAQLLETGVRADRIGVFVPTPDPYLRTLVQHFAAAGIPANGPTPETLATSVAGRTLLDALALPSLDWRRDRLLALVAGAPLRQDVASASVARWERISREAGIVAGLRDWHAKLAAYEAQLQRRIDRAVDATDADIAERARRDSSSLGGFVALLAEQVRSIDRAGCWLDAATAARGLLDVLLDPDDPRVSWPERERVALERVGNALDRLAGLDDVEPDPATGVFRRALQAELDVPVGRWGRFGDGVVFGPLSTAVGQDLDAVFVLGLTEGLCPTPRRDDALLPDPVRRLAGGELPLRSSRLGDQHRELLVALASAPEGRRTMLHPRGDLRGGRDRLPSRWLLPTASRLAGTTVRSTAFHDQRAPVVEVVASFASGLDAAPTAASVAERDIATVARWTAAGGRAATHPTASLVERGLTAMEARRSHAFTAYDGNLAGLTVPSPATGSVLAPTRLEDWASCGFRYFLAHVLRVDVRDDPERILELSALDSGTGQHRVLERFLAEVIDAGPPGPDTPWSAENRRRVAELADEILDELERTGRTGRRIPWLLRRQEIHDILQFALRVDDGRRAAMRATPEQVELPFGFAGSDPVTVDLPDGRSIRFRGRADRVDRTESGDVVVIDYKTGGGGRYRGLDDGDPVAAGTMLQLGVYAEAARQLLDSPSPMAEYRVLGQSEPFGYRWDEPRRRRFVEVVQTIVDGIEGGVFDAVPGDYDSWRRTHDNCRFCAYDEVCPRDRGEHAEAKAEAPELAIRARLQPVEDAP